MIPANIPIIKISLAAFSMLVLHYKKIIALSILPIILMLPMLFSLPELYLIAKDLDIHNLTVVELPLEILLYALLFIYGYSSIQINLYRLITSTQDTTFKYGIVPMGLIVKFILLSIFISLLNLAPVVLQMPLLKPVIFILIAHILLNLVLVANGENLYKWKIPLVDRISIAILQFVIPTFILSIASLLGLVAIIIAKIFLMYWVGINLGLIYNQLRKQN